MQCTNCGREVPDAAKVCGHCGHRLKAAAPAVERPSFAEPAFVKRAIPGWVWGLSGVLGASIIGLIVLVIVAGLLLLGNNNSIAVSDQPAFTVMPTLTAIPTSTLMQTEPAPTETLQPTVTLSPVPLPRVGLFPDADTVWDSWVNRKTISSMNDITLEDFASDLNEGLLAGRSYFPYTVKIKQSQSVIWNTGWCSANEEILRQNISQTGVEFYINAQQVSTDGIFAIHWGPNGSHYCNYLYTVLKDWPVGTFIVTTVKVFKSDINDGVTQGVFPAGRKVIEYTVSVSP